MLLDDFAPAIDASTARTDAIYPTTVDTHSHLRIRVAPRTGFEARLELSMKPLITHRAKPHGKEQKKTSRRANGQDSSQRQLPKQRNEEKRNLGLTRPPHHNSFKHGVLGALLDLVLDPHLVEQLLQPNTFFVVADFMISTVRRSRTSSANFLLLKKRGRLGVAFRAPSCYCRPPPWASSASTDKRDFFGYRTSPSEARQ